VPIIKSGFVRERLKLVLSQEIPPKQPVEQHKLPASPLPGRRFEAATAIGAVEASGEVALTRLF
jgi:hypothetical protein